MTRRDFFNAIAANETLTEELRNYATAAIEQMDVSNEKRKEKNAEKAKEKEPLIHQAVSFLGETPMTASEIAQKMEIKVQSASPLLKKAVIMGLANVQDVKVPKKGIQKGYTKREDI